MPSIPKPLRAVSADDISLLVSDRWAEDDQLEFKEDLPSKDGKPDIWHEAQEEIGDRARNAILGEVVAFANAHGGDVVLGVGETSEKPPRANSLHPLPRCSDLAHRLELAARDCIEPALPQLEVKGIPTDASDTGYVVLRTGRSRAGPHRLKQTLHCYQRSGSRTEKMTMRQIQDLTLYLSRGLERVEQRFQEEAKRFAIEMQAGFPEGFGRRLGLRVVATPLNGEPYVEKVHEVPAVTPLLRPWVLHYRANGRTFPLHFGSSGGLWRIVLRGTSLLSPGESPGRREIHLSCDGMLRYITIIERSPSAPIEHVLFPGWLMSMVLNAISTADRFRAYAGAHGVEFGLEVEIATVGGPVRAMRLGSTDPFDAAGEIQEPGVVFPKYVIGSSDQLLDTFKAFYVDYWAALGIDAPASEVASVEMG